MAIHDRNYGGKKNGTKFFIVLAIIGMIFMIGLISDTSEPKCIEPGCDNKQASNSSYCYFHRMWVNWKIKFQSIHPKTGT